VTKLELALKLAAKDGYMDVAEASAIQKSVEYAIDSAGQGLMAYLEDHEAVALDGLMEQLKH